MGLPEKLYFTISEIAVRWGCTTDLLFHYFEMGILHPCVISKTMVCELWEGKNPGEFSSSRLIASQFTTDRPIYFWNYNNIIPVFEDYQEEIHLNGHIFVLDYFKPTQWIHVPTKDVSTYVMTNDDFIITKNERDRFEKEYKLETKSENQEASNLPEFDYVDKIRIDELKAIKNDKFDLTKLLRLIDELNHNWKNANYYSSAMIVRTIINHIPPIFGCNKFNEVCNNYKGSKSFKEVTQILNSTLRKIADEHLHSQISKVEVMPNKTQVDFSHSLDLLLAEIIKLLK